MSRQAGWFLVSLLLVNSVSIAIGYPAFTVLSLAGVAPEKQGMAAGIQSTLCTAGSGLGLSFIDLTLEAVGLDGKALVGLLWDPRHVKRDGYSDFNNRTGQSQKNRTFAPRLNN